MPKPNLPVRKGPQSFSVGMDKLFAAIRPHGRPETRFPSDLGLSETNRASDEDLHAWFTRMIDLGCAGRTAAVAIERHIAAFAHLKWSGEQLVYASVPILVADRGINEYHRRGGRASYLRLDLNDETLGTPFSHPLPHIHVGDGDRPRFALDGGHSGNVIVDFFDFIYRNHATQAWLEWARRVWLADLANKNDATPFDAVVAAFQKGNVAFLRAHADTVRRIKSTLRVAKDSMFKAHMNAADRELLDYAAVP